MNRERIENYKALVAEIKSLEAEIENVKGFERIIADVVTGSTPEFPWIATHYKVIGLDNKQEERLVMKIITAKKEIENIETFISTVEDKEMQSILRNYYINGKTQNEIAEEMLCDRSTIAKKIDAFWKVSHNSHSD